MPVIHGFELSEAIFKPILSVVWKKNVGKQGTERQTHSDTFLVTTRTALRPGLKTLHYLDIIPTPPPTEELKILRSLKGDDNNYY